MSSTMRSIGAGVRRCCSWVLVVSLVACGAPGDDDPVPVATGASATTPTSAPTTPTTPTAPSAPTTVDVASTGAMTTTTTTTVDVASTEAAEVDDRRGVVTLRPVIACGAGIPSDESAGQATLPQIGDLGDCVVGAVAGGGEMFTPGSAAAVVDAGGRWAVTVDLRPDAEPAWSSLASMCFEGAGDCPSTQLAIVLDDIIQSAPTLQTPDFPGTIQISGAFTEDEARALALVFNTGASPSDPDGG